MTNPEVRELWRHARAILETDEVDSREIRAAVLIMATVHCGPNVRRLREFTGIPLRDVTTVSYYLRKAHLWGNDWFRAPWLEDDVTDGEAQISLVMHVLTGCGDIVSNDGETWRTRLLADEFPFHDAASTVSIPWRNLVPRRPLKRIGGEDAQPEPYWVRDRHAAV